MKKHLFSAISLFLALSLCGCRADIGAQSAEATSTPTATSVAMPSPTAELTPSPTVDPMQERLRLAPDIDGLIKAIENTGDEKKVVYRYTADNPYGEIEDAYAGEYRYEVYINNNQVGGLSLMPAVTEALMQEQENLMYDVFYGNISVEQFCEMVGEYGYGNAAIPFDISKLSGESEVLLTYTSHGQYQDCFLIEYEGILPVVCICHGTSYYLIHYESETDDWLAAPQRHEDVEDTFEGTDFDGSYSPNWKKYEHYPDSLVVMGNLPTMEEYPGAIAEYFEPDYYTPDINFGGIIFNIESPAWFDADYYYDILKVNGVPVFLIAAD